MTGLLPPSALKGPNSSNRGSSKTSPTEKHPNLTALTGPNYFNRIHGLPALQ